MSLLVFAAATRTSAEREKLHQSRDFLNHQADELQPENSLVLAPDNLTRRTGTQGLLHTQPAEQPARQPTGRPATDPARATEAGHQPLDRNWAAAEYLAGRPPRDEQTAQLYQQFATELTRTTDPAVLNRLTTRLDAYDAYNGPMTWTEWTTAQLTNAAAASEPGRTPPAAANTRRAGHARTIAGQAKRGFPQPVHEQLLKATGPASRPPGTGPAYAAIPKPPER